MPPTIRNVGQVTFLGSFPKDPPKTGLPEVAFAGRSNVGKSSTINVLLGRKKAARVSRTPGRTRHINLFQLDRAMCFADLPGYGFARIDEDTRRQWGAMIEGYLTDREALRLMVILVDGSIPPQPMDRQMLDAMAHFRLPTLVLANKIDRLNKSRRKPALAKIADALGLPRRDVLPFSATKKEGLAFAWGRINSAIKGPARQLPEEE